MLLEITIGSIVIVLYSVWFVYNGEMRRQKQNLPPGCYEFPLIGGMVQLILTAGLRGQHYEKLHRVSERYGRTYAGRAGDLDAAYTEDYETAKEVLSSPDWSNRFPSHPRFKEHLLYQNLGLMWSDGEPQREIRKFTFKTFKAVGFGELKTAEVLLQEELGDFVEMINKRLKTSVGNELFIPLTFKAPTFNILWRVLYGSRFPYDDPKIKKLIHAVDDISEINIGLDPEWFYPILRYIPGCSPSRTKRDSFITCHQFFIDIMNERREKGTYKEIQNDFIDHFLKKIDEEKDNLPKIYNDQQFHITCVDLLFGGLDTTANSLEFAILYMVRNLDVQKKVQEEIDFFVGSNRLPSITDRTHLRYCEATMLETLRCANIVPMNGRTASCDTKLGKYNVKKDTICALNTTIIHMSKEIWGDPEVFRPERFLDDNNHLINTEKVLAFGGGTRHCPGFTMAKVIWLAFFTAALQNFTFESSPIHPELSIIPNHGVTNNVKPYYCIVTPRTPSPRYVQMPGFEITLNQN